MSTRQQSKVGGQSGRSSGRPKSAERTQIDVRYKLLGNMALMLIHSPLRIANEPNSTGARGIRDPAVGQALWVTHQVVEWPAGASAIKAGQQCVPDRAYPRQTFVPGMSLRPGRQRSQPASNVLDSIRTNPNCAGCKTMDYKQLALTHSVSWIANEANLRGACLGGAGGGATARVWPDGNRMMLVPRGRTR